MAKKRKKATDLPVTREFLQARADRAIAAGYSKQRWIEFCEIMMARGREVFLYEARQTVSKYITVVNGRWRYKVRFSNHLPNRTKETKKDCDFFVGRGNFNITTTGQAVLATDVFFEEMGKFDAEQAAKKHGRHHVARKDAGRGDETAPSG